MERNKKFEIIAGVKENVESKIPISTNFTSAKEASSKVAVEKKTSHSLKTTVKATITSSKLNKKQITNPPKNVARMSIAKISKDMMNELQVENLKSEDHPIKSAGINPLDKENAIKRSSIKEKNSQTSQKTSGRIPIKPLSQDLKPTAAYGGLRFIAKRNACQKNMFQKMTKLKKPQAVNHPECCSEELKPADSAKVIAKKEIQPSNEENLDKPSTAKAESSKAMQHGMKESTLKKPTTFGGIRFIPKWQSTPLKPDLFDKAQEPSKCDKELYPPGISSGIFPDSPIGYLENIPNSSKALTKDKTITLDETISLEETLQLEIEDQKRLKIASNTIKEASNKIYPAFSGMRMVPKRKSTCPKPDMFARIPEESKINNQESDPAGSSAEEIKVSSGATKKILKTETQSSHVESLGKTSSQKAEFSNTVSNTIKKAHKTTAFGGMRFAPKWNSTAIRPNMIISKQKESKTDCPTSHPTDSSIQVLKIVPPCTTAKIKDVESNVEKLYMPKTQKPELPKNDDPSKAVKKVVPPAFGGMRFIPKNQKNLNGISETRKS